MAGKIVGWVLSGLLGAFMLLDAGLKFAQPAGVAAAFARTGGRWTFR